MTNFPRRAALLFLPVLIAQVGCTGALVDDEEVEQDLDVAFRIDISEIDVVYEIDPEKGHLQGSATLRFEMRPGQTLPLFHFDPQVESATDDELDGLSALRLDGETLDLNDDADVQVIEFEGSRQRAVEIQRPLGSGQHQIEVQWSIYNWYQDEEPGWFYTDVNDIEGWGNEALWPTLNVPSELARHRLTLNVHSDTTYRCMGSGEMSESSAGGIQTCRLDTVREVASYTVMAVVGPRSEMPRETRTIGGREVTIASMRGEQSISEAFEQTKQTLAALDWDFGAWPQERLRVMLMGEDSGMEYFEGTITSLDALSHELIHQIFGTTLIAATYRDSWMDEAINTWYGEQGTWLPLPPGFCSAIVSGRAATAPGFNSRGYLEGAAIIDEMADAVGGRSTMIDVLAAFQQQHWFQPVSTGDFLDFVQRETGVSMHDEFAQWLYCG